MPTAATTTEPMPTWAAEIIRRQERIERHLQRLAVPVDLLTAAQVAKRLGISERAAREKIARIFTDTRAAGDRRPGCERHAFSDEVEVYVNGTITTLRAFQRDTGRRQ